MKGKDLLTYLVPIAIFSMLVFFMPAFAQETDNSTQYDFQPDQTTGEPILEQVSDKGIYRVAFKWPTQVLNTQSGIEVEIVFLNASAPPSSSENIPQTESNSSGASEEGDSGFNVPGSIESTLPVESYDIAIYSNNGTELFIALDQPGQSGRGTQHVQFEDNYKGPVTIEISDIKPGWDSGKAAGEELIDSVTIAAVVVPEFSIVVIGLLGAVMGTIILVGRTRLIRS